MTKEEREDLGFLLLMQAVDQEDAISEAEFFEALRDVRVIKSNPTT